MASDPVVELCETALLDGTHLNAVRERIIARALLVAWEGISEEGLCTDPECAEGLCIAARKILAIAEGRDAS